MDVAEASFQQDVVERSRDVPVVVDFWAAWCGPCHALAPVLEREAAAREGKVALAKVDVDANPGLGQRFDVRGIPAVKAFRNGHVVDEFVGVRPPQFVADFLDGLTGPTDAERLLEELQAEGELPDVVAALDAGDHEQALDRLLAEAETADAAGKDRVRRLMVALFADLGPEHPLSLCYRRRLASLLFY